MNEFHLIASYKRIRREVIDKVTIVKGPVKIKAPRLSPDVATPALAEHLDMSLDFASAALNALPSFQLPVKLDFSAEGALAFKVAASHDGANYQYKFAIEKGQQSIFSAAVTCSRAWDLEPSFAQLNFSKAKPIRKIVGRTKGLSIQQLLDRHRAPFSLEYRAGAGVRFEDSIGSGVNALLAAPCRGADNRLALMEVGGDRFALEFANVAVDCSAETPKLRCPKLALQNLAGLVQYGEWLDCEVEPRDDPEEEEERAASENASRDEGEAADPKPEEEDEPDQETAAAFASTKKIARRLLDLHLLFGDQAAGHEPVVALLESVVSTPKADYLALDLMLRKLKKAGLIAFYQDLRDALDRALSEQPVRYPANWQALVAKHRCFELAAAAVQMQDRAEVVASGAVWRLSYKGFGNIILNAFKAVVGRHTPTLEFRGLKAGLRLTGVQGGYATERNGVKVIWAPSRGVTFHVGGEAGQAKTIRKQMLHDFDGCVDFGGTFVLRAKSMYPAPFQFSNSELRIRACANDLTRHLVPTSSPYSRRLFVAGDRLYFMSNKPNADGDLEVELVEYSPAADCLRLKNKCQLKLQSALLPEALQKLVGSYSFDHEVFFQLADGKNALFVVSLVAGLETVGAAFDVVAFARPQEGAPAELEPVGRYHEEPQDRPEAERHEKLVKYLVQVKVGTHDGVLVDWPIRRPAFRVFGLIGKQVQAVASVDGSSKLFRRLMRPGRLGYQLIEFKAWHIPGFDGAFLTGWSRVSTRKELARTFYLKF